MTRAFSAFLMILPLVLLIQTSGCGYSWQGASNRWKAEHVEKVYVKMLNNVTLKPGIEVPFTTAIIKQFARGSRIKLVSKEDEADATLSGVLLLMDSAGQSPISVTSTTLDPAAQNVGSAVIFTEYSAAASVSLTLVRKSDSRMLWTQAFNRSKIYPAGNRFGLQGTTSALIDASQEYSAIVSDLADFIASDAYDTMMEAF